jgi:hypothetical protein
MHNFVLAHASCNRSKSNTLAARSHLERWVGYIQRYDDDLKEIAVASGRLAEVDACRMAAPWGYTNAAQAGAHAWLRQRDYERVGSGIPRMFYFMFAPLITSAIGPR